MTKEPTALDIAREYLPEMSDDDLNYVIWNHTGFPSFWRPEDGKTPEECFRTQLKRFAEQEEKP